jgi:hypothetical protein
MVMRVIMGTVGRYSAARPAVGSTISAGMWICKQSLCRQLLFFYETKELFETYNSVFNFQYWAF